MRHQLAGRRVDARKRRHQLAQVDIGHGVAAIGLLGMAVRQADADVEDAVGAGEYPAITLAQLLVPDHLQRAQAAGQAGVAHIGAQRNAAGRVALAHAGGHQRTWHRTSGQHHPAGAQFTLAQ